MNIWPFNRTKKTPSPKPIRWDIPYEHQRRVCQMVDQWNDCKTSHQTIKWDFWDFIYSIMPRDLKGTTAIKFDRQNPYIEITPKP